MKRSLAILALAGLVAAPAAAQDAHVWTEHRPDAVAPASILGGRMLPSGGFHFAARYDRVKYQGIQIGTEEADPTDLFEFYARVPFERKDESVNLTLGYGLTDRLGLMVSGTLVDRVRGQATEEGAFNYYSTLAFGDLAADLLIGVYEGNTVRAHAQLGVDLPTGSIDESGPVLGEGVSTLPYDMQSGTGSVVVRPAITALAQNEHASVGAQVEGHIYATNNDRGYRYGNGVDARMWAAYPVADAIAITAGVHYERFGDIQGFDSRLDPSDDPGEDAIFNAGSRVYMPLGVTIAFPDESLLRGAALQVEYAFPVHQEYDNFRLRADTGLRIGLQKTTGF